MEASETSDVIHRRTDPDETSSQVTLKKVTFQETVDTNKPVAAVRNETKEWLYEKVKGLHVRVPIIKKMTDKVRRIPPRYKYACFMLWILWKFIAMFLIVYLMGGSLHRTSQDTSTLGLSKEHSPLKVLYIVTSLAEFNSGRRETKAGQDRLGEVMLPVLIDSVESMTARPFRYQVDVVLILAYKLRPERERMIRDRLPPGVGLQVWDDACPLSYDGKKANSILSNNTRALSRQHRYVVKDKLLYYDLFMAFEDDMRITGHHIQNFVELSQELNKLRLAAPSSLDSLPENMDPKKQTFFGPMSRGQMDRIIPGFVRVEVLLNATESGAQQKLDPIPLDYQFTSHSDKAEEQHFDPSYCCHAHMSPNVETPVRPSKEDVVIWETSVKALSVRLLPPGSNALDWVVLLPGPGKRMKAQELIGGYWSGREAAFGAEPKPTPGNPELIAQQGGWMATREQIVRLNSLCQGSFLPPFDEPIYKRDGQESNNVEFWSGGYQFFTGVLGGCNFQRVVSMDPDRFSKHFIYHVANNKQKQLARRRMVKADHLFGQLNTVKKMAERAKAQMQVTREA